MNQHYYHFEQVVDGSSNQRNIAMLLIYKKAIDELAETRSMDEVKSTILYQMYEFMLIKTSDYLMEV